MFYVPPDSIRDMCSQSSGHYMEKSTCHVLVKNAMSTKKNTRNTLILKKKCEFIDFASKNPHLKSRALAEKFGCGKIQLSHQNTVQERKLSRAV